MFCVIFPLPGFCIQHNYFDIYLFCSEFQYFLFMAEYYYIVWVCQSLIICWYLDRYWLIPGFGGLRSEAAVHICIEALAWTYAFSYLG